MLPENLIIPQITSGRDLQFIFPRPENRPIPGLSSEGGAKRILVVDDEEAIRELLVYHLSSMGHECMGAASGTEAAELLHKHSFDAMLSDIRMPKMSGLELLRIVRDHNEDIAILMVTANQDVKDGIKAMKLGADDYVLKPFSFDDVSLGLNRAIEKSALKRQIRAYRENLEKMVAQRTSQIKQLFVNVIQSLVFALEAKDRYTDGHSRRVAWLAMLLGQEAKLEPFELELLQVGAMFHDLGKIGIRESVLSKPGSLTPEEWGHIKTHPEIGVRILQPLDEFKDALPIVRHHHERYDGSGYPDGIQGEAIPTAARIVAIVDAFDAMTSARPYRDALGVDEAIFRLKEAAGFQFDPGLVRLFVPIAENENVQEALFCSGWTSGGTSPHDVTPHLRAIKNPAQIQFYCGF